MTRTEMKESSDRELLALLSEARANTERARLNHEICQRDEQAIMAELSNRGDSYRKSEAQTDSTAVLVAGSATGSGPGGAARSEMP